MRQQRKALNAKIDNFVFLKAMQSIINIFIRQVFSAECNNNQAKRL